MRTVSTRRTVLVVEGDQKIRGEMHRTLEARGFRVISAWDAQDVLGFLATHSDPIDAAVVDSSMIGDRDLLDVLRQKRPGIRILVTRENGDNAEVYGSEVIGRPFEIMDVVERLSPAGTPYTP